MGCKQTRTSVGGRAGGSTFFRSKSTSASSESLSASSSFDLPAAREQHQRYAIDHRKNDPRNRRFGKFNLKNSLRELREIEGGNCLCPPGRPATKTARQFFPPFCRAVFQTELPKSSIDTARPCLAWPAKRPHAQCKMIRAKSRFLAWRNWTSRAI